MTLPIRPEDYGDPNWCPDCGEPRGVCRCEEMVSAPTLLIARQEKQIAALKAQLAAALKSAATWKALAKKQRKEYNEEVEEFNAGAYAGEQNIDKDGAEWIYRTEYPDRKDYDVFDAGYAWGKEVASENEISSNEFDGPGGFYDAGAR